ncbi:uncharacterized protein K452DRAFT_226033 [Aplosporella prunicola CBS 121167]|uniref:DUF6594 domain-containing protein n=1 Tax=Aplosporella prunicola CBS 121167 TaxID=1176127 RepID=A0A6A6BG10_9PEZI|nr:uncharacterized protein K452DRAFT_226033 [Aplosporella prunicola CBS 121167]KAF2143089.1 hypothetical protein K452DRAFT_226033 [Aplosporella prunicola CBS 121167]
MGLSTLQHTTQNPSYRGPTRAEKRKRPYIFMGYPALSKFLASDDDAFVIRRYGALHARTILMLQEKIRQLEHELAESDRSHITIPVGKGYEDLEHMAVTGSFAKDRELYGGRRWEIMHELAELLEKYDRLVLYYSKLKEKPKMPRRIIRNVQSWFSDYPTAIESAEQEFINKEKDLIALVDRPKTPLRRFLESFSWFNRLCCWRVKQKAQDEYTFEFEDPGSHYYNDSLIDYTVTLIVLLLGLGMLLGPAWWLNAATSSTQRLTIICIFVPLFMILLVLVTAVKPFETVAATSAYAAVLMVFMQMGAVSQQSQ